MGYWICLAIATTAWAAAKWYRAVEARGIAELSDRSLKPGDVVLYRGHHGMTPAKLAEERGPHGHIIECHRIREVNNKGQILECRRIREVRGPFSNN